MSTAALRGVVRGLVLDGPPTDAALVTRYAKLNDHGAFAELLRRHGPVVLGVCRRTLGHADADDAFQAVFLVLARKADSVRPPGSVGGWLYGVAVRTAKKAKVAAARRWRREMNAQANADRTVEYTDGLPGSPEHAELRAVIDAELARLPDKLRLPVVLCDLGGKTRSEAARELGLPDGTVAARLHQARKLLAVRLSRRGVALPAAGLGVLAAAEPVRADLARATLAAAEAFAKGAGSPAISTTAQSLAEGVVRAMNAGTWKVGLGVALAAVLAAGGGLMWASDGPKPARGGAPEGAAKPEAKMTIDAPGYVSELAFTPSGQYRLVVAGGTVTVSDPDTGKVRWTAPGEAAGFVGVRMGTRIGRYEVYVMTDKGVVRHDAASGTPSGRAAPRPKTDKGWHLVRFSPDGTRYAAHFGNEVRVYETQSGREAVELKERYGPTDRFGAGFPPAAGRDVFFSPDGKKVVGVGVEVEPGNVGLGVWDVATGHRGKATGGDPRPLAAAVSPDGVILAEAFPDHVALWGEPPVTPPDAADRIERTRLQPPERYPVAGTPTAVAFSPDGKTLAVGVRLPNHPNKLTEGRKTEVQLLDAATGKEVRRLAGFGNLPVVALAFSPDGKTLAAGTGLHPADQQPAAETPKAGEVKVFALTPEAAPPQEPNPKAGPPAIVERNQDLWAWQERPRASDEPPVHSVAFAPDGKAFAVGRPTREVVARDAATSKTLWEHTWDYPHMTGLEPVHPAGVAYSPDGRLVAVTRAGGAVLLDAATGKTLQAVAADGAGPTAAAFAQTDPVMGRPHYRLAVTDGRATWVTDWVGDPGEVRPGFARFGPLAGAPKVEKPHASVAYSPDGKRVVFIPNARIDPTWPGNGADRPDPAKATHWYAQVWGGGSGEPIHMLPHGPDPVTAVAWAPDGRIATADDKGTVVIWDGTTYKERKRVKLSGPVTALAFRADGKRFAAGVTAPAKPGEAGAVRIEVVTEQEGSSPDNWMRSSTVGLPAAEVVKSVVFSPDGLVMIAGTATADGKGGGVRVWDRAKLAPKDVEGPGQKPVPAAETPPPAAAAPAPTWAAKARLTDHAGAVHSAAFAPNGKTLYTGGAGGPDGGATVVAFDAATLKARWRGGPAPAGFTAVAVTPDGKRVVATRDKTTGVYDAATGRPVLFDPPLPGGRAAAVSPDGKWLALGDGFRAGFRAWDEADGVAFVTGPDELKASAGKLPAAVAWSPDSRRLAHVQPAGPDADGVVAVVGVWPDQTPGPGNLVGHKGPVLAVAWSADGKLIATGGADGRVILWDAATYRERSRTQIAGRNGGSTVHALAFSPADGTVAAGVQLDAGKGVNRVVLIDPATGKEGHHLTGNAPVPVSAVAFSPDGKTLVMTHGPPPGDEREYTADELKEGGVVVWERGAAAR